MEPTFRASMNWLHTWAGVVLGGLLFAIFWMGALSVFDREIDRWMMPSTRLSDAGRPVSIDALGSSLAEATEARAPQWAVLLPYDRQPVFRVSWRQPTSQLVVQIFSPDGNQLHDPGTLAGTGFIYPFHYMLHLRFSDIGIWLVGFASMGMLVLCVSGVIVHRRLFANFFSLRIGRKPRAVLLDLHNATGVVAWPFHVLITLSGLVVFFAIYFPGGWQLSYPSRSSFQNDAFGGFDRGRSGRPAQAASLDAVLDSAQRLWHGDGARFLSVRHLGDASSYVSVYRRSEDRVGAVYEVAYFDASSGMLLARSPELLPSSTAQRFLTGLHMIQFRHWSLRWLYFGLGLIGCVMIATGFLFWLESRRRKHEQLGLGGVRLVEGLTIGSVTGILIATLAFFIINRLLPLGTTFLGQQRAALEVWFFYLVWLATFAHAWLRLGRAWIEQCWVIVAFAVAAMLLNWITTGDHLARSISHRHLWAIFGMDLLLLAGAAVAVLTARKLQYRAATARAPGVSARIADSQPTGQ